MECVQTNKERHDTASDIYRLTLTRRLTLKMDARKKCKTILVYIQAFHKFSKQIVKKEKGLSEMISNKSN